MNTRVRAGALSLATVVLLTACSGGSDPTTGAPTPDGATPTVAATANGEANGGGEPASGQCPEVPQEGFDLFSSPLVAEAPVVGQVYGGADHPVQWTFAEPLGMGASIDLYYVNEQGDAIAMGGLFLEDQGNNTWGTSNDVFWSDAADRPGFAVLTVTHDATADDNGKITADTEIAGVYCLTYTVTE